MSFSGISEIRWIIVGLKFGNSKQDVFNHV